MTNRAKLFVMMALQFFIWGAWLPLIFGYLPSLGFTPGEQSWILNAFPIAAIVGKQRTVGTIASSISVELYGPGRIRRMAEKGGDKHTVFRVGEIDGKITDRVNELVKMFSSIDSAKATPNLQGERWTKLTQNGMSNGICAATGLTGHGCDNNDAIRRFAIQVAGESIRVGRALGLKLEKMGKLMPEQLEQAQATFAAAQQTVEADRAVIERLQALGEKIRQDAVRQRTREAEKE